MIEPKKVVTCGKDRRLPAEWEEQDGVLLAWPHAGTDWLPHLPLVEPVFAAIVREVSLREEVYLLVADEPSVRSVLEDAGALMTHVRFFIYPTDDTWSRDFGPVTVFDDGAPVMLDFGFNGWGLKFRAARDNRASRFLHGAGCFAAPMETVGIILEGGSIESDGSGTILTTAPCLLEANRNPHLSRAEIEEQLAAHLGARRVLWLENGYLAGDDTDSHIDTLARLAPDSTIVHVACDDPADEHFPALAAMVAELGRLRTEGGAPYRLVPLPWPRAIRDDEGERLPATYANFLVINGAVLVPTYGDPRDEEALAAVRSAFPGREIVGIDCRPLILQHGSLHCVTMQIPRKGAGA